MPQVTSSAGTGTKIVADIEAVRADAAAAMQKGISEAASLKNAGVAKAIADVNAVKGALNADVGAAMADVRTVKADANAVKADAQSALTHIEHFPIWVWALAGAAAGFAVGVILTI